MKTQNLLKSIFGTAFIALLLLMVSCDTGQSALVGQWVEVEVPSGSKYEIMELLSDGTGIVNVIDYKGKTGVAITWKTEKDRFYVTAFGLAESMSYKLQGNMLTFTDDNGKISKYVKCKKDCQETAKEFQRGQN
jgi:hypothetical protein